MRMEQSLWKSKQGWETLPDPSLGPDAHLVLLFGSTTVLKDTALFDDVKSRYPNAHLFGCSTAGEIFSTRVFDDTLVVTAIHFVHTHIKGAKMTIRNADQSYATGETLSRELDPDGLRHLWVLSDGLNVNGSALVKGITRQLPPNVTLTGGLSADGDRFNETVVIWDAPAEKNTVALLGFYGTALEVGYGSLGGWDPFGPERLITRAKGNILYEVDGKSVLALYKQYLGEHADALPAAGLLFPLSIRNGVDAPGLVRTLLGVDEKTQSMTFAGDVPEGAYARLMKANFNRLIDGAAGAALASLETTGSHSPELAILISCVGRKMVLKQRVEEEVEAVRDILGTDTFMTGFYSYGEISPFSAGASCELHNQTMTITTLTETTA